MHTHFCSNFCVSSFLLPFPLSERHTVLTSRSIFFHCHVLILVCTTMNLHVLFSWISNLNSSFICSCLTNWPVLSNIFVFSTLFCPAKVLIEELECLAEDVYSTTLTASLSILEASDCFDDDDNLPADSCEV